MCSRGFQKRLPKRLFTDFLRALVRWLKHVASLKLAFSWLRLSNFPSTSGEGAFRRHLCPTSWALHPPSLSGLLCPVVPQLVAPAQSLARMPHESFAWSGPSVALCL